MPKPRRDLSGLSFGWLEVKHMKDIKGRHAYWSCKCRCGVEVDVRDDVLTGGQQVSCGCRKSDPAVAHNNAMRRPKAIRVKVAKKAAQTRWASTPLTPDERARLSQLTTERLLLGPLTPEESTERERLRLRLRETTL